MLTKLTSCVVLVLAVHVLLCEAFSLSTYKHQHKRTKYEEKRIENGQGVGNGGQSSRSSETTTECDGMNIICEQGDEVVIKCDAGKVIKILNVVYGNQNQDCGDADAFNKVSDLCNGQSECRFTVDDTFFSGTNCRKNIKEKFTQSYECVDIPASCAPPRGCGFDSQYSCQCDISNCVPSNDCCADVYTYCGIIL